MNKKKIFISVLMCLISIVVFAQKEKGLGLHTEAGLALDRTQSESAWQMQLSPGYHINKTLFLGVGCAYHKYNDEIGEDPLSSYPIYLHGLNTISSNKKLIPFIAAKVGYGIISKIQEHESPRISATSKYSGGRFFSPSIGLLWKVKGAHLLTLSCSYDIQKYKLRRESYSLNGEPYYSTFEDVNSIKTFSFNVGWLL